MFRCDFSIETRYFLFKRNIRGVEAFVDANYGNLIKTSSKKYNVPYEMLRKIMILEVFHRGKWYYKLIKNLMLYCFPKLTKKLDISIGIAQVKYKTILNYYENQNFNLKNTIKPSVNIDIAAFKLKQIIDFWQNNQDEIKRNKQYSYFVESLPEKELFTRYVYEKYTTGGQFSYVTYLTICAQYLSEGY